MGATAHIYSAKSYAPYLTRRQTPVRLNTIRVGCGAEYSVQGDDGLGTAAGYAGQENAGVDYHLTTPVDINELLKLLMGERGDKAMRPGGMRH